MQCPSPKKKDTALLASTISHDGQIHFHWKLKKRNLARAFYEEWICRFGTLVRITINQEHQFESHLFRQLMGTIHLRTSAYHPQANGMVERLHHQLKTAMKCHANSRWTKVLPTMLLGIRAIWREDLKATVVQLVYGETLRLPEQFLVQRPMENSDDGANFVKELRCHFNELRPIDDTHHGERRQ